MWSVITGSVGHPLRAGAAFGAAWLSGVGTASQTQRYGPCRRADEERRLAEMYRFPSSGLALETHEQLTLLVVIDEYTRECLAIEVDRVFTPQDVIGILQHLLAAWHAAVLAE